MSDPPLIHMEGHPRIGDGASPHEEESHEPQALEKKEGHGAPESAKTLGDIRPESGSGGQKRACEHQGQGHGKPHDLISGKGSAAPVIGPEKLRKPSPDLGDDQGFQEGDKRVTIERQGETGQAGQGVDHRGDGLDGNGFHSVEVGGVAGFSGGRYRQRRGFQRGG